MKLILTALILLPFLLNCNGRPDGAPLTACSTLMPKHPGTLPSKNRSPYVVSAELTENNKVKVRISSPDQGLEGFVLQARSKTDPSKFVSGTFTTSPGTKTIDCFKNVKGTLTHDQSTEKKEVVTEWTPDPNVDEDVIFRATVAENYYTFWTDLDSQPIAIYSATDKILDLIVEGCSETKGCFGLPNRCIDESRGRDCKILLTYYSVPSGVRFSLHGYLDSLSYMAVGLSEDSSMGEDSVNECIRDNSDVIARESWNVGKSNTKTKNLLKSDYHSKYSDGLTSCSWVKQTTFETQGMVFDLENNFYHLLLATGPVDDGKLKYHTDRLPSTENFNLTEFHFKEEDDSSPEIDGIDLYSHPVSVPTSTEKYMEVSTSAVTNHTEEEGGSHGSQLSFNAFYVILALLLASRVVQV